MPLFRRLDIMDKRRLLVMVAIETTLVRRLGLLWKLCLRLCPETMDFQGWLPWPCNSTT